MTFALFSSILCSGFGVVAAGGADSSDVGWDVSRVISEREQSSQDRNSEPAAQYKAAKGNWKALCQIQLTQDHQLAFSR